MRDSSKGKKPADKPWAVAIKKKTASHQKELKELARQAEDVGQQTDNKNLLHMAKRIASHAEKIPTPKTRDEIYHEKLQQQNKSDIER